MNNCTLRKHLYDAPAAPHAQYIQPISSHWPHFTEMASEWFLLSAFTQASLKKLQWFCCLTLTELWGKLFLGEKNITGAISSLLFAYHTSGWWLRWYQLEVSQMSQLNCLKCPKLCLCIYVCVCASVSVCMCFCLCASSHTLLNIFKFFNLMTCDWRFKSMCEHSIISSF